MKKIISRLYFCFFITIICSSICHAQIQFFQQSNTPKTNKVIAMITMSFGDVLIKTQSNKNWLPAAEGQEIVYGDRLQTKDSGRVEVTFTDGSVVFLGKDSEIEFIDEKNKEEKKKTSIFLYLGSILNTVNKGTQYEVETIHALATVKGTYYEAVSDQDQSSFTIKDGVVVIENELGEVEVNADETGIVNQGQSPFKRKATKKELEESSKSSDVYKTTPLYNIKVDLPPQLNRTESYPIQITLIDNDENLYTKKTELLLMTKGIELIDFSNEQPISIIIEDGRFSSNFRVIDDNIQLALTSSSSNSKQLYIEANPEPTSKQVFFEFSRDGIKKKFIANFKNTEND